MSRVWCVFGLVPIMVGLAAILGWLTGVSILVQYSPDIIPIAFNAAVCFLLIGFAFLFSMLPNVFTQKIQAVLSSLVLVLAILSLSEDLFNIDLHIDQLFMKFWIKTDYSLHPGRMSPNAAINFIFSSLVLIYLPYGNKKSIGIGIDILIFLIFIISVLGLSGYLMQLEFLYGWYSYTRMALASAICFLSLSIGLWAVWHSMEGWKNLYRGHEETKIILLSSAIMLCIAIAVTLANFSSIVSQENNEIRNLFLKYIQNGDEIFMQDINRGINQINAEHSNPQWIKALAYGKPKTPNSIDLGQQLLKKMIATTSFVGASLYDSDGKEIVSAGKFVQQPGISIFKKISSGLLNIVWEN